MPGRSEPFVNGQIYHVFNKTIESKKVFIDDAHDRLFLQLIPFYRSDKHIVSYSAFKRLPDVLQKHYLSLTKMRKYYRVEVLCFCLMPTHFHFLIKQTRGGGLSKFISDLINSYTRFYNEENERKGPLFLPRFKSVRIKSREQLIHVSRYIHLNPYSSGITKSINELLSYRWSSIGDYVKVDRSGFVYPKYILQEFSNDRQRHMRFIVNHADYQRNLEFIKHADKWK